jgi:hypothetical protein
VVSIPLDEALRRPRSRTFSPCTLGLLLNSLSPEDRAALDAALAKPREEMTNVWIREALIEALGRERVPSSDTIARHRRGACQCPR